MARTRCRSLKPSVCLLFMVTPRCFLTQKTHARTRTHMRANTTAPTPHEQVLVPSKRKTIVCECMSAAERADWISSLTAAAEAAAAQARVRQERSHGALSCLMCLVCLALDRLACGSAGVRTYTYEYVHVNICIGICTPACTHMYTRPPHLHTYLCQYICSGGEYDGAIP